MATTIFASSMSLDGYIAAPSGELVLPVPEAPLHRHFNRLMEATAVAVYGRRPGRRKRGSSRRPGATRRKSSARRRCARSASTRGWSASTPPEP